MDDESVEERLRAVERAVADGEAPEGVAEGAALAGRVADAESSVEELDDRLADVEAAVQALRGYVGAVRGVNRDVERRADAALARVERLEGAGDDAPSPPGAAEGNRGGARRRGDAVAGPSPGGTPTEAETDRRERAPGRATGASNGRPGRRAASDGGDPTPHPIPEPTPRDDRSLLERVRAWL